MRLLYISNSRIPTEKAHGIQVMKMCEAFSNLEVNTTLVIPTRNNPGLETVDVFRYYDVEKKFEIIKLKTLDPYYLIKLPQGIYIKFQAMLFIMTLRQFLKKQKITDEIIYTREEYLLPLLQRYSEKVVWEAHNLPQNKARYLKFWNKCKKIVVITEALKKELSKLGVSEDKIIVASDGVDLEKFKVEDEQAELRFKLNLPQDKKIVMYTGHLYDWKGADALLEAARKFMVQSSTIFIFIGGTDYEVEKFRNKTEQQNNVLVLGHKPYPDIPQYLNAADVLVLPNSEKKDISKNYTSPLKMFEYMTTKKPIVASDIPSVREVLNHNNSILVKSDSPEDLVKGIFKALDDQTKSNAISEKAYQDVQKYDWRLRAERIINTIL